jgi:XTP/dITP diphosphohydrolase
VTTFVLATANPHKVLEMRAVMKPLGIELLDRPADVDEVDETGDTLEANALSKARALVMATQCAAIADDTGLFVDALDGRPGVRSARYAGEAASYDDNVAKLLDELEGVETRGARFVTVIAVAYPDGTSFCVEGELKGTIARSRAGDQGFGYDPVFVPEDGGRTLAELTPQQKNATSHRARALRELSEELNRR